MMRCVALVATAVLLESFSVLAQTTAGTSTVIVVPVIAQTSSFGSEVTIFNPNAATITVNPVFYDAQNTGSPGAKTCTSLSVGSNLSTAFSIATQCALPSGSNFGLLVLTESTGTQRFYGFARTQTPQGVGFATEGFPIEDFNDQVQHATGLKRVAASGGSPAYQTNCFVDTLGDAVDYELQLFDGGTNAQLGSTLSGSLAAYEQYRYLDVFAAAGVAAGDKTNVRAQFTNLTANDKKLIGFCTVQENTSFSADFRIAKSYGGTPQNAFVQGGNAFGTTALIGTTDNQPVTVLANNTPTLRLMPATDISGSASSNTINGFALNSIDDGVIGGTIAGGGVHFGNGDTQVNHVTASFGAIGGGVGNTITNTLGVIGGGQGNAAGGEGSTVGGGVNNTASGFVATTAGGAGNTASGGYASVSGGLANTASGTFSFVAGGSQSVASGFGTFAAGLDVLADESQCAVFGFFNDGPANCKGVGNIVRLMASHGFSVDWGPATGDGGGTWWVEINDITPCRPINTYTNAYLSCSGVWTSNSDRNKKENFTAIDPLMVLNKVVALPVTQWNYKAEPKVLRIGPMAQDFYAAFGVGQDNLTIAQTDEAGVAFAAIQGLNQLVRERDAHIDAQQRALEQQQHEIEDLRGELEAVKKLLTMLRPGEAHITAVHASP